MPVYVPAKPNRRVAPFGTDLRISKKLVKIELNINLKTRALGLTMPLTLQGRADEMIEYSPFAALQGSGFGSTEVTIRNVRYHVRLRGRG